MSTASTTSTPATSSASLVLSAFAAGLFATLITDEEKQLQPVLDGYLGNVSANPSLENATAQSLSFQTQIMALAPTGISTGIKDTAQALKLLIDVQLPSLVQALGAEAQAAAAGPSPTPTPAPSPAPTAA